MTAYSSEDVDKLKRIVQEGIHVTQEVDTLKEGLRDTVKAVAEELGIKPYVLNKAISLHIKQKQARTEKSLKNLRQSLNSDVIHKGLQ